jgi:hypothetical protein
MPRCALRSDVALSPIRPQIRVCAINALLEFATIDNGSMDERFKAPALKTGGVLLPHAFGALRA